MSAEPPAVDEALVARLWQTQRFARHALRTVDGGAVEVVYPGRRRGERGPDFQEALLAFADGELQRGGVEVHLRSGDWARHGHQRDPAYNETLLHVVLWHDAREPPRRADGSLLPTVVLADHLDAPLAAVAADLPPRAEEWPRLERGACGPDAPGVAARLDAAGLARFEARRAVYEADLQEGGPGALLLRGLVEAAGYGTNREAARRLAAWVEPDAVRVARHAGVAAVQALLLGGAGLLPSQRGRDADAPSVEVIEAGWHTLRPSVSPALAASDWRFFGVRPASAPPRRLAGLAVLLTRAALDGLLADAARAVCTLAPRPAARALAHALYVGPDDAYWLYHWDFGRATARPLPALIGPERAAEMVVNVVLPLLAAWGAVLDDAALSAAAVTCYVQHPPAGDNERLRHMRRQVMGGEDRSLVSTACRQQGLLHVYAQTCGWRRCGACVVGPGP